MAGGYLSVHDVFIHLQQLLAGHQGVCAQQQQSFPSVAVAVATLPELSVLNSQVSKVSLADQLKNPYFVGTIFAPINSVSSSMH